LGIAAAAAILAFQAPSAEGQQYWGNGGAGSATEDCDPVVQSRVQAMSLATVDNATAMAQYGYTPMPAGGTSALSCLDSLLSGGVNIIFSVPTIDQLLSALINTACNYAGGIIQQNMSYLSAQAQGSLQMGELIPGVPMPNITGGFSVMGSQSGSNITVLGGGQTISNFNTYWGGSQGPSPANPYGSLFGGTYTGGNGGGGGSFFNFNGWFGK
jgi:hypothetical protein